MADNNNKGGGGQQKAANGLTMSVGIDPADMNENKLANVAGIAGVTVLAALALRWGMPLLRKFGFGISDEAAKANTIDVSDTNALKGAFLKATEGGQFKLSELRHVVKTVSPALASMGDPDGKSKEAVTNMLNALTAASSDSK